LQPDQPQEGRPSRAWPACRRVRGPSCSAFGCTWVQTVANGSGGPLRELPTVLSGLILKGLRPPSTTTRRSCAPVGSSGLSRASAIQLRPANEQGHAVRRGIRRAVPSAFRQAKRSMPLSSNFPPRNRDYGLSWRSCQRPGVPQPGVVLAARRRNQQVSGCRGCPNARTASTTVCKTAG
jgi:hypothetical protein